MHVNKEFGIFVLIVMEAKYYKISKENAFNAFPKYKETEYTKNAQLLYVNTQSCEFVVLCFVANPNKIIYLTSKLQENSDEKTFELIETNRKELIDISIKI